LFKNKELMRGDALLQRVIWKGVLNLPQSKLRSGLIHSYRRKQFEAFLDARLGSSFRPVDPGPIPPLELILQTNVLDNAEVPKKSNPAEYVSSSCMGMLGFLNLAEKYGLNVRTVGSILEFGMGTAINLRLFRSIEGVRLVGTDVNPRVVEWCKANLEGIEFYLNELEPPLVFDDNSFDFVFAASVFTHIPLEWQDAWLREIRRVLRPRGIFICTVAGRFHIGNQLTPDERAILESEGEFTLTPEDRGASLATKHAGSWDVFQTRSRVLEAFGTVFDVREYVATSGQDVLALSKPPGIVTTSPREPAYELAEGRA
jgi:SAM-dependent methyltransferase